MSLKEALANPEKAINVSIYGGELESLPQELAKCKNLEQISILENPGLTEFPEVLFECKKLRFLEIRNSHYTYLESPIDQGLRVLPEGIRNLKNLEVLIINWTDLDSLSPALAECKKIKELDLSNNMLTDSSKLSVIGELENLEILRIGNNSDYLPASFSNLKKLKEISLQQPAIAEGCFMNDGLLRKFPTVICKIKSLEILNLSGEMLIRSVPSDITGLDNLKELVWYGSKLRELPAGIGKMKSLELIVLGPECVHGEFWYEANELRLPIDFFELKKLKHFHVGGSLSARPLKGGSWAQVEKMLKANTVSD